MLTCYQNAAYLHIQQHGDSDPPDEFKFNVHSLLALLRFPPTPEKGATVGVQPSSPAPVFSNIVKTVLVLITSSVQHLLLCLNLF